MIISCEKNDQNPTSQTLFFPLDASLLSTIEEQLFISDDMTSYW